MWLIQARKKPHPRTLRIVHNISAMSQNSRFRACLLGTFALSFIFGAASSALADERDFVWTYDWRVPYKGERELEFWLTDFGGGKSDFLIEFEYGVDGHYMFAPYIQIERDGNEFRVNGWKFEQRYAFGGFRYNKLLPAVYFEVKRENNEPFELEGKFIATVVRKDGTSWSGNIIAETKTDGVNGIVWEYATGIMQKHGYRMSYGIEAFGNITKKRHFIGPTVGMRIKPGQKITAGYGFSSTGDPGRFRFLFQLEF